MSIKLLEMRKAPAESEAFNLDNLKLQIFLICSVYNDNKLHPGLWLDVNNTISLWSVLTKKFSRRKDILQQPYIPVSIYWEAHKY